MGGRGGGVTVTVTDLDFALYKERARDKVLSIRFLSSSCHAFASCVLVVGAVAQLSSGVTQLSCIRWLFIMLMMARASTWGFSQISGVAPANSRTCMPVHFFSR
jgi:hypothetical protein